MKQTHVEKLLVLAKRSKVFRSRDLDMQHIPRWSLRSLLEAGSIERLARGLYAIPNADPTSEHTFAEAARLVPHGVVCLLSALRLHGLTTQAPFEIWMAISVKARRPKIRTTPLRIVRFSGPALTEGIEVRTIERVSVHLYSPAKTVADCFKYRNKIGLDVALEALRDCWKQKKSTMDDLYRMAKVCRVGNVMRPYLESLV